MKRIALSLMAALAIVLAGSSGALAKDGKVTLCHAAGLDGTTHYVEITVARPAAFGKAGHFYENGTPRAGHEQDYLGPCVTTETTPTPISTSTPMTSPSPQPEPSATPSPNVSPTPTSTLSPTPTPEPSASLSPSNTPLVPDMTLPPTDTVEECADLPGGGEHCYQRVTDDEDGFVEQSLYVIIALLGGILGAIIVGLRR